MTGPTVAEEIEYILKNEVDLDSSPGEDGITYRYIKRFWGFKEFQELYLSFLNFTRSSKSTGLVNNVVIMTIKNKKAHSLEYSKKRKLTKLNKDTNLGNGKVWSNRFKEIIIPKILPRTQFCCQKDLDIIDEIVQIREVNQFLLGNKKVQRDGAILSIDFKDAFRSVSLRWFNLVMKRSRIPEVFQEWFKMMYKDLYIHIVVSQWSRSVYLSRTISSRRGQYLVG